MRLPVLWVVLCAGCAGGIHRERDQQVAFQLELADPFRDHPVWGIGRGTAENWGLTAGYQYFLRDRWGLRAEVTPLRMYSQGDDDVYAAELRLGIRWYPLSFHTGKAPTGVYVEALGGHMWAEDEVPPAGTKDNWTQDFGTGLEWRLGDRASWILGYRLRHLSNGKGSGSDNPSQNEHVLMTALALSW